MFINFLMNYYLYTNFGKIFEKNIYTLKFEKKFSIKNIYFKILKKILEKIYTLKF